MGAYSRKISSVLLFFQACLGMSFWSLSGTRHKAIQSICLTCITAFLICGMSGFVSIAPWEANDSLSAIHINGKVINAFFGFFPSLKRYPITFETTDSSNSQPALSYNLLYA